MNENSGSGSSETDDNSNMRIRSVLTHSLLKKLHELKHQSSHDRAKKRQVATRALIDAVERHPASKSNIIVFPVRGNVPTQEDISRIFDENEEQAEMGKVIPFRTPQTDSDTPPFIS